MSEACLPQDSRNVPRGNRDVKSWIPKSLNPYFDKLDRIDRMTGARRLYQRCPSATMSKRDKKEKKDTKQAVICMPITLTHFRRRYVYAHSTNIIV